MAVIKQGILGALSGKVGSVIGGSWKGIAYLRSRPASVANPRTAGQVTQRNSFTAMIQVASLLLAKIVKPLWDRFAQFESGYNAFVGANIKCFVNGVFTNFSDFIIARGKLVGFDTPTITMGVGDTATVVDWLDNTGEGDALATDESYGVYYNETQDAWGQTVLNKTRDNTQMTIVGDVEAVAGDVIHVWIAFRRADGTSVSDSQYITDVVPA
jgi:hypothetical protein